MIPDTTGITIITTRMNKLSFLLFLTTLIFAPLAFGSVETWSIGIVEILVFLSLFCCFFKTENRKSFYRIPGILPLLLLPLYIFLQLIPLPAEVVNFLAPKIYAAYAPILDLQESNPWIPLTVNQKSTLLEFLRISCYAGFYIITVQLLSRKEQLTQTVRIIVWLGIGIAFLAILQKFTSPDQIYWFRPTPENSGTVGPYVYHNHYAGFMELVFPLVLALFFYYRPKFIEQQSLRERTVSFFSAPGSNVHFILGFGVVLILTSVFIALSRGGTIAITLGLFLFLAILSQQKAHSGKFLFLLVLGCVLLAVTCLGWDPILEKFNKTLTETGGIQDSRLLLWQDSAPLIRDFLFTGSGFGTFVHTYPQYSTIPSTALFNHAHNDYIELLTDGGLIGFGLASWFVLAVLKNGIRMLIMRRDSYSVLLSIGGIAAIFSILVHSITDFNMHNGANGLYFYFICGILVSAGNTRLHFRTRPTLLRNAAPKTRLICLTAIPLLLLAIALQGGIIQAKQQYQQTEKVYLNPQLSEKLFSKLHRTIDKAIQYDPLEGLYSFYKGNLFNARKEYNAAVDEYLQTSMKNPLEGAYLQRLAMTLPPEKNEIARKLMAEGYVRSQNKEKLGFIWVEWLLRQDRTEEATKAIKLGMAHFPNLARKLPPLLLVNHFSKDEIISILPSNTQSWIQLGTFAEKMNQLENAEYFRLHALDFLEQEQTIKPKYFNQIYWFYKRQKKDEEAADILRQGIEWLPDYTKFHLYLGEYYQKQDIIYRAIEEYQQILFLEPGNTKVRQRLEKILQ